MKRILNFWRLKTYEEDEFIIEYYQPFFKKGCVVTDVTVNEFVDPVWLLWGN